MKPSRDSRHKTRVPRLADKDFAYRTLSCTDVSSELRLVDICPGHGQFEPVCDNALHVTIYPAPYSVGNLTLGLTEYEIGNIPIVMDAIPPHLLPDALAAFREAVSAAGGQVKLGEFIGRTQGAISKRLRSGKPVWDGCVLSIEEEFRIPRWRLRPDLYPPEDYQSSAVGAGEARSDWSGDPAGRARSSDPLLGIRA